LYSVAPCLSTTGQNHSRPPPSRTASLRSFLCRPCSKSSKPSERTKRRARSGTNTSTITTDTTAPWPIVPTGHTSAAGAPITAQPDRGLFSIFSFRARADRLSQPKTRTRSSSESVTISTPRPHRPSRSGTESALDDWREMMTDINISAEKPLPAKPLPPLPALSIRPPSTASSRTIRPVTTVRVDTSRNESRHRQRHDEASGQDAASGQPGPARHPFPSVAETWQAVHSSSDTLSPIKDRQAADLERDSWFGSIGSIMTIPTPSTARVPSLLGSARIDSPTLGPELREVWNNPDSGVLQYTMLQEQPFVDRNRLWRDMDSPLKSEFEGHRNGDTRDTEVRTNDTGMPTTTRRYTEVNETHEEPES
jgi:hypothetical protein